MTELLKLSIELIHIADDLRHRLKTINFDEGDVYIFEQIWASTALGFGGCGGSTMTSATTCVFIPEYNSCPEKYVNKAFVYFGGRFAYSADICERLKEDIRKHNMASCRELGRYKHDIENA